MAYFNIKSDIQNTKSNTEQLFDFMADFHHFKHLLPENKIENFECSSDQCSFNIKGMMPLTIKIKERTPKTRIIFETLGLAKFVFTLHINLNANQTTQVQLEGDMNPFIKVMAEKPLTELVNTMATKLAQLQL